jgi:oligoendopeptidase F
MSGHGRLSAAALAALVLVLGTLGSAQNGLAQYTPDPNSPRSDVPAKYQWNPYDIFPSTEAWDSELKAVEQDIPKLGQYEGHLGESAETMVQCLHDYEDMDQRISKLYSFANLIFDVDQSNSESQARLGKVRALFPKYGRTVAFIEPEMLSLEPAVVEGWMAQNKDLAVYKFEYEELLRQKEHTLSPAEEKILAMTNNVRGLAGRVHQSLMNVDLEFPEIIGDDGQKVRLTMSGFSKLRSSPVYAVRRQAADAFFGTLRSYENTFSTLLDGVVNSHILNKDARGYDSCLEAALYPQHISTAAYKMLIETINENLQRTLHKYITLRKKVLKLDGPVTFPNLYNPIMEDYEPSYTYDEGRALILKALAPLGKEYLG